MSRVLSWCKLCPSRHAKKIKRCRLSCLQLPNALNSWHSGAIRLPLWSTLMDVLLEKCKPMLQATFMRGGPHGFWHYLAWKTNFRAMCRTCSLKFMQLNKLHHQMANSCASYNLLLSSLLNLLHNLFKHISIMLSTIAHGDNGDTSSRPKWGTRWITFAQLGSCQQQPQHGDLQPWCFTKCQCQGGRVDLKDLETCSSDLLISLISNILKGTKS